MLTIAKPKIAIFDYDLSNLDYLCCELYDDYELYPISDLVNIPITLQNISPNLIIINLDSYPKQSELLNNAAANIPLLIITAAARSSQTINTLTTAYINKPYTLAQLHNCINQILDEI